MLLTVMTIGTATTSCSDWNDHYDANSNTTASSGATLWENITSNSNLSQFATLLKKAGFADKLNTSQVYTVWAPLNGTYENDYNSLLNTDSTTLLNEFVYNHVARFNHPASGTIKDNIMMLNAKKELFSGSTNNYAFAGVKADTVNLPSSNGIFHVINGKTTYMTNLYEYLSKRNSEIDSIGNYFKHYEHKILDTENSVPGPTVNGEITYLDSVFIKYNSLFYLLNKAYIDEEDSSYTMIVPTNTAWNKAYNKVNSYFNYLPSFVYTNRANFYSSTANDPKTIDIDNYKFLKDSVTHYNMIRDLVFNNNLYANKALEKLPLGGTLSGDSLVTTSLDIIKGDYTDIFKNATAKTEVSNGYAWTTDSLRIKPWDSWCPIIKVEGEYSSNLVSYNSYVSPTGVYVNPSRQNPKVKGKISNNIFMNLQATGTLTPEFNYRVPNVLSTTYSIYCVMVPANIIDTTATPMKDSIRVTLGYNAANGSENTKTFNPIVNRLGMVDTVYVGEFTFPMAYKGLETSYYPYLKIRRLSSNRNYKDGKYDKDVRIDCFLFVPKEYEEYKAQQSSGSKKH